MKRFEPTPKPKLEAVLDWANIEYNPNRHGNQMCHCPLGHSSGRTESLSVNLDKQVWNCKACGGQGTSWDLIMEVGGTDFRGAVKVAAAEQFAEGSVGGNDDALPSWSGRRGARVSRGSRDQRVGGSWRPSWGSD